MHGDLVEKYIRTKRKTRKVVTYREDNCALRTLHESALKFIRGSSYPSLFAKAYIPHRGIFENAKAHLYNDIFIKLDIKDFFNSINHKKLETQLYIELNKVSEIKISRVHCQKLVEVASCGYPGLPLGLVTSPDLANLYLKGFDSLFYGRLKKYPIENPIYTRYADDLIISFKYTDTYKEISAQIISDAKKLLKEYYLRINEKKTQVINLNTSNHVKITGINVVKKENNWRHISVGKKLKNELFWKAIHYFDYPSNASYLDIERLKGTLSFVLSIEKTGISSSFSEKMQQIVRDRGYSDICALIKALPREQQGAKEGKALEVPPCCDNLNDYENKDIRVKLKKAKFDCGEESTILTFEVKNKQSKPIRIWLQDIDVCTWSREKETAHGYKHLGDLDGYSEEAFKFEVKDSWFKIFHLTPSSLDCAPYDPDSCCALLGFILTYDFGEDEDAGKSIWAINPDESEIENEWVYYEDDEEDEICFTSKDILYIYKGNIRCHRYGHNIIQATAILHSKTDDEIELNVEYCTDCEKFLLEYTVFEEYRNRYGVLIGNFRMVVNGEFDGEYDLAEESPLKLSGYTVNQRDGYTSRERHYTLARIIHDGIMEKGDVIRYLSYFIRKNGAKRGNEAALEKWREDLRFVQQYDIETQPKTIISEIRRY